MRMRFVSTWGITFVIWMAGSFVVHGLLLHADYLSTPALYRTEGDSMGYFPFMLLAHFIMAGALTWIYAHGHEPKPWLKQGVRFGVAVALLNVVPMYLIYYAVQPLASATVIKQIVFDSILVLILGLVIAFIYRNARSSR